MQKRSAKSQHPGGFEMEPMGRPSDMMRQMERMQREMMKDFGRDDHFKDFFSDPFSNRGGFGIFERAD